LKWSTRKTILFNHLLILSWLLIMFPWINASGVSELDAKDWNSELDDWMQFHDLWNLKLFRNGNSYVKGNWVGDVQGKRVWGKCFQWFKGNMTKRYWKRHPRIQIDFRLMRETQIMGEKLLYWFQIPKKVTLHHFT
jgi:hypothetical protein